MLLDSRALLARMAIQVVPARTVTQVVRAQLVRLVPPANQATTEHQARTAIPVVPDLKAKLDSLATLVIILKYFRCEFYI